MTWSTQEAEERRPDVLRSQAKGLVVAGFATLPLGSVIPWPSGTVRFLVLGTYVVLFLVLALLWERRTRRNLSASIADMPRETTTVVCLLPLAWTTINGFLDGSVSDAGRTLWLGLLCSAAAATPAWAGALWLRRRADGQEAERGA